MTKKENRDIYLRNLPEELYNQIIQEMARMIKDENEPYSLPQATVEIIKKGLKKK